MSGFATARFGRLLLNDALRLQRSILYSTSPLLAVVLAVYSIDISDGSAAEPAAHMVLFGIWLICAGLLMTGLSFQDLHQPQERSQYLMLPVSSFERLLSRYLLTGPLFVLFAVVAFIGADHLGNLWTGFWFGERQTPFPPLDERTGWLLFSYLLAHAVMLIGAICFRTHAFVKTILFLLVVLIGLMLIENLAERILFPDAFTWTRFASTRPLPTELMPWFASPWLNVLAVAAIYAWLLRIAFVCLRDYEATDGV